MTVQVTTLGSGLRIATDVMPGVETVSVGVWVAAGARYESLEDNGISHMLEHMAFKGTRRRSAQGIAEEIEAVGGHINAYTSREFTAYFARVLREDLALAVDLLADILQHSVFDEAELARERDVVLQEIGQVNDTPDDLVFDHLQGVAFPDQPMGRAVLGTPERVSVFGRQQLLVYMASHYKAPRMVVAGAGAVDHDVLVRLAGEAFGELNAGAAPGREPAQYMGGELHEERDLEQVHLVLAFAAVPYQDPDYYAAQVLSTVLGGGMSSRLFQEIREKRGLAYSIYSFASSYFDAGLFGVYAGTGLDQAEEVLTLTCAEIDKVCAGVTEDEVARARAQHKAGLLMGLESSPARCEQLGRQLLIYGRPIPPDEITAGIDAVDAGAVSRTAWRLVAGAPPALASLGPLAAHRPYAAIAKHFGTGKARA